jgi:hypothetical protein
MDDLAHRFEGSMRYTLGRRDDAYPAGHAVSNLLAQAFTYVPHVQVLEEPPA